MQPPREELVPVPPASAPDRGSAASEPGPAGALSRGRKLAALIVAALSDALSLGAQFAPPLQIAIDVITAAILFWVLGFRWPLLPVLAVEAIPGLATFPTWLLVVSVITGVAPTSRPAS